MLTLYLVRHGQTAWSREYRFCGSGSDVPLAPEGVEMAEAFASFYGAEKWQAIYSSPLQRARQTAEPLARNAKREVRIAKGLEEIAYGAWEGLLEDDIRARWPDEHRHWLENPAVNPPTGGESGLQIAARSMAFVEEVKRAHASGSVAAVSHKGTIRVLVCMLLGIELSKFRAQLGMPASAVTIFEFRKDGPFLLAHGDTAHVPPHLRHDLGA
jgi:probable phosphoglycerate mutase